MEKNLFGYFFIDSLHSPCRANLISHCLEFLNETGAIVVSLTLDANHVNKSAVEYLVARLQPNHNWRPWFPHPSTRKPVHVFLDAAHMLKLWRN